MNSDEAVTSIFRINIWYRHQHKKEAKGKREKNDTVPAVPLDIGKESIRYRACAVCTKPGKKFERISRYLDEKPGVPGEYQRRSGDSNDTEAKPVDRLLDINVRRDNG